MIVMTMMLMTMMDDDGSDVAVATKCFSVPPTLPWCVITDTRSYVVQHRSDFESARHGKVELATRMTSSPLQEKQQIN